jgi:CDP-diacylglycerol--glycerol-3-phosphate 3-phosphatidyltransferase
MNFPNILTSLRIFIALIAPFYLINESLNTQIFVGVILFIAILTDWLDGWYARKYKQETKLGKILDPIADKMLVLISFSVFVYLDVLSFWWIIPIFVRELIITTYRFIFLSKNIVIAASNSGKIKTVIQVITLGLTYFLFMTRHHFREYFSEDFYYLLYFALLLTLFFTIKSGISFIINNWKLIKEIHQLS